MPDGSLHPEDDSTAQGQRAEQEAIRKAVDARLSRYVADKDAARLTLGSHEQAVLALLDALAVGDAAIWLDTAGYIARHLTEQERAALTVCLIKSMPAETSKSLIEGLFEPGQFPGLDAKDHKASAAQWAQDASQAEIRAYVHEGTLRMPPETRNKLGKWLNGGVKV